MNEIPFGMVLTFFLTFIFIAVVVNVKNAKFLLSGYNTMTDFEQTSFDIERYISFFKKYFLYLAISYLLFALLIYWLPVKWEMSIVLCVLYPLLGILLFLYCSGLYYKPYKFSMLPLTIGMVIFLAISAALFIGLSSPKFLIEGDQIRITGPYGASIKFQEIKRISDVSQSQTLRKIDGFELGHVKKGNFESTKGEIIRVISSSESGYMVIETDTQTYFVDKNEDLRKAILEHI